MNKITSTPEIELKPFTLDNLTADGACESMRAWCVRHGLLYPTPERIVRMLNEQPDYFAWAVQHGYSGFTDITDEELPYHLTIRGWLCLRECDDVRVTKSLSPWDVETNPVTGHGGTAKTGDGGTATSGMYGTSVSGSGGTSISEAGGTSISGDGGTSVSGNEGFAASGVGGVLRVRWYSHPYDRCFTAIAYVGKDGIKPNALYGVDKKGRFFEVPE